MFSELYRKYVALPWPKELGHDSDALQMRDMDPFISSSDYCWEDWEKEVEVRFPVRWFINKTIPNFFRPITRLRHKFTDMWYWVKCHTLKSYRFHMIDIRESNGKHPYRSGWIDADNQILLANFSILKKFVEVEKPHNLRDLHTEEEIDQMGARTQQDAYDEVMNLYHWWMVDRHVEEAAVDAEYKKTNDAKDKTERHKLVNDWIVAKDLSKAKEEEMLIRLIKVRQTMWT